MKNKKNKCNLNWAYNYLTLKFWDGKAFEATTLGKAVMVDNITSIMLKNTFENVALTDRVNTGF
jgi:hypothetical protein